MATVYPATQVFDLPVRHMIALVPTPSALERIIAARQACFCEALRSLVIASSRPRTDRVIVIDRHDCIVREWKFEQGITTSLPTSVGCPVLIQWLVQYFSGGYSPAVGMSHFESFLTSGQAAE